MDQESAWFCTVLVLRGAGWWGFAPCRGRGV